MLIYYKIRKSIRTIAIMVIVILCFSMAPSNFRMAFAVEPAANKPVFYTPSSQYQHFPRNGPITIQWFAPTNGVVDHYLFSWRELADGNMEIDILLHNREELSSRSIMINPRAGTTNRIAVAAVMSNGTEK